MKITWYNGDELCGTQDVEIRPIDDPNDMKYFCPRNAHACQDHLFGTSVITMMTHEAHKIAMQFMPADDEEDLWYEGLAHEFMHSFYKKNNHNPPHVPYNTHSDGAVLRTDRLVTYFDDVKDMAKVGRMIEDFMT